MFKRDGAVLYPRLSEIVLLKLTEDDLSVRNQFYCL